MSMHEGETELPPNVPPNLGNEEKPVQTESTVTAPPASPTSLLPEGYLHPSSILFEALAQIRQFVLPALFGLAGVASGNLWGIYAAFGVLGITLLINTVRFLTLRYKIKDADFVVTEGLLFRRVRSVPIRRIQNIDYVQNLFHRFFDVAVVNIETASGDKPEATLRVITMDQVEELRAAVNSSARTERSTQNASSPSQTSPIGVAQHDGESQVSNRGAETASNTEDSQELLWAIPAKLLFIAGLTSNRGTVFIGIILGTFFQSGWEERFDWRSARDEIRNVVPSDFSQLPNELQLVLFVLAALFVLRVLSISWFFLRFYGYRLALCGEDLRISCGLFTKVNATVPRKRIQFISIHRPLLMRPFGLAAIRIETAGGGGSASEDAAKSVSRRWFIPVIPEKQAYALLESLRPTIQWQPEQLTWQPLSPKARRRMMRLGVIASLLTAVIGFLIYQPRGGLAGAVALPLCIALAAKRAASRKYSRASWGIIYQSGVLNKKLSMTFLDRVQTLDVVQSFFDRRWNMATLRIDTAAAGPASHLIEVAFLDEQFAHSEFAEVTSACASTRPEFE